MTRTIHTNKWKKNRHIDPRGSLDNDDDLSLVAAVTSASLIPRARSTVGDLRRNNDRAGGGGEGDGDDGGGLVGR